MDTAAGGRPGYRPPCLHATDPNRGGRWPATLLPLLAVGGLAAQTEPALGPAAGGERERYISLLRQLDLPYTDWTVLRDVGEKVAAAADRTRNLVAVEVEVARRAADPRYRLRLLGVQVAVEPDVAIPELERVCAADDDALAALAARIHGRSGAAPQRLARLLAERLVKETRVPVRGALVLAAGEAAVRDAAPLLVSMLEKGGLQGSEVFWAWTAVAQTADAALMDKARLWLEPHSPLLGAAVLLTRRFADRDAERALVRLLEVEPPQPVATWVAQSLGAVGSDVARQALRRALEVAQQKAGGAATAIAVDARRLALLRLHDSAARQWCEAAVARSGTMLESGIGRVPELFGRWRLDGAAVLLADWAGRADLPALVRCSAARGLCWLEDPRGIEKTIALLGDKDLDVHQPAVVEALQLAQRTLVEFVDDLSRPDACGFVLGDGNKAAESARQWRLWLEGHQAPRWRTPPEDTEDARFWY